MFRILIITFALAVGNRCFAQELIGVEEAPKSKLSIKKKGVKYLLRNGDGKTVLSNLDSAYYYSDSDVFFIEKKTHWGVISSSGNITIPVEFDTIERCYNWFWEVTKNQKKGIYNIYRGVVLNVEYDNIEFSSKVGKEFIVEKDGKKGIFNDSGEEVIPLAYDKIKNTFGVITLNRNGKTSYFIGNKIITDSLLLDKRFEIYGDYISDTKTYYVFCRDGKQGVIDSKSNIVIEPKYQDLRFKPIRRGNKIEYLFLAKQNNLWGLIEFNEAAISGFKYQNIEVVDQDFAIVGINGYRYFYNYQKKQLVESFNFDSFHLLNEDYSMVRRDDKESYVDNKNQYRLVLPLVYENVMMHGSWFIVRQNSLYGVVDKQNQIVIPIQYESISLACNKVIAQLNGKYGILSLENKPLFPFDFPLITSYDDKIEVHQIGSSKLTVYDCNLKVIEGGR